MNLCLSGEVHTQVKRLPVSSEVQKAKEKENDGETSWKSELG
jgi:hypothetical protein